jgi:hypothetical protein
MICSWNHSVIPLWALLNDDVKEDIPATESLTSSAAARVILDKQKA